MSNAVVSSAEGIGATRLLEAEIRVARRQLREDEIDGARGCDLRG